MGVTEGGRLSVLITAQTYSSRNFNFQPFLVLFLKNLSFPALNVIRSALHKDSLPDLFTNSCDIYAYRLFSYFWKTARSLFQIVSVRISPHFRLPHHTLVR